MVPLLAAIFTMVAIGGSYQLYSMVTELSQLRGIKQRTAKLQKKNRSLESALKAKQQELDRHKRTLSQTRQQLNESNRKLAKIEADKPKGVRKFAKGASKIPIIGSIASAGLLAADAAQAARECYEERETCKKEVLEFIESSRESAEKGAEYVKESLTAPPSTED